MTELEVGVVPSCILQVVADLVSHPGAHNRCKYGRHKFLDCEICPAILHHHDPITTERLRSSDAYPVGPNYHVLSWLTLTLVLLIFCLSCGIQSF